MTESRRNTDRLLPWIVVGLVCAAASWRILTALSVPALSEGDPVGLFRTDPALIHYIAGRIVDNGGWPPEDFRSDPRIESPELTDIPAMFTVGQEFLVAWGQLLLGPSVPFHLLALVLMSIVASLTVIGIAGLARELTGSSGWAALAGIFYVMTMGSYRTAGYMLLREDLSLPLLSLHLYLLVRAARLRSPASILLAALAAVAALATWHAMTFVFAVEIACLFAWWLRTGEGLIDDRQSRILIAVLALGSLAVPVLQSKIFLLSLPMQMLVVMALGPALARIGPLRGFPRAVTALALLVLLAVVSRALTSWLAPGVGDYAHVVEMMLAKIRHLGARPEDPEELSYGARLLWQGVFATGSFQLIAKHLGVLALLTPIAATLNFRSWWRGRGDKCEAFLTAFASAALVLALLVSRLVSLAAILLPVVAVLPLRSRLLKDPWRVRGVVALVVVQGIISYGSADTGMLRAWYNPAIVGELASTLHFIRDELPGDDSIAADFVTSAAVLAQSHHRVILQPKYETTRSRERIERFTLALYHETPHEFRRILRSEFGARYLLVDAGFLWRIRYEAGIRQKSQSPPLETAAYDLLNHDESVYATIPGYRLLYQSKKTRPRYRLYELLEDER